MIKNSSINIILSFLFLTIFSCSKDDDPANIPPTITLTSPKVKTVLDAGVTTLELSWTGVDKDKNKLTYNIYFGETLTTEPISKGITKTSYTAENLETGKTYLWKIEVTDGIETISSETRSFSVDSVTGLTVNLKTPDNNKEFSPNAANYPVTFDILYPKKAAILFDVYLSESDKVAADAIPIATDVVAKTNNTYLFKDLKSNTLYYWKVVAKLAGTKIESTQKRFIVGNSKATITLTAPVDGKEFLAADDKVVLNWKVTDADKNANHRYNIYIGETLPTTPTIRDIETTSVDVSEYVIAGNTYFWKIVVEDARDEVISETRSFKTAAVKKGLKVGWRSKPTKITLKDNSGTIIFTKAVFNEANQIVIPNLKEGATYTCRYEKDSKFKEHTFIYNEVNNSSLLIGIADIRLETQEQVDQIGAKNYHMLANSLRIRGSKNSSDQNKITSLASLSSIKQVSQLEVNNTMLTNLDGLQNISLYSEMGYDLRISISKNEQLQNISLPNIKEVWELDINENENLESITMPNLKEVAYLRLGGRSNGNGIIYHHKNPKLKTIAMSLEKVSSVSIYGCDSLTDFSFIESLGEINELKLENNKISSLKLNNLAFEYIVIKNNPNLVTVEITKPSSDTTPTYIYVQNNNSLTSLNLTNYSFNTLEVTDNDVLVNLIDTEITTSELYPELTVTNNKALTNYCNVKAGTLREFYFKVTENKYTPTYEDFKDSAKCKE